MADDNEKWLAWYRGSHNRKGEGTTIIRLESEPVKHFTLRGPATPEEIAEEKARRAESEKHAQVFNAFRSRPDYIDAQAIRDLLEWMTPTHHPLDKLTPEEWAQLRKRRIVKIRLKLDCAATDVRMIKKAEGR